MESFTIESPLKPSAIEALLAANGLAMSSYGSNAKRVHTFVVNIFEIDGEWKAVIHVAIEPKVAEEAEEKKEASADQPNKENIHALNGKEEGIDLYDLIPEMYMPLGPENAGPDVHFYMHPKEADIDNWDVVLPNAHPEYYYHFLESGSSWEAAQRIFPDVDFGLAAEPHLRSVKNPEGKSPSLKQPKPTKNSYILELTDEF